MPKPASGNDPWKAVAVKLPPNLLEEVGRYADLYHVSVSQLIREGLELRLHGHKGGELSSGITVIHPTVVAGFARLADTLSTAADQLRKMYQLSREEKHNGDTDTIPGAGEPRQAVRSSGNTVISSTPESVPTDKAAIVSRLRQMRAQGLSLAQIAAELTAEGIPTLKGKSIWQKGTVDKLLNGR
jgi:hypothetical protein